MKREQVISFIKTQLDTGVISNKDLDKLKSEKQAQLTRDTTGQEEISHIKDSNEESSRQLMHLLYGIGTIITIIGVVVLLAQNWKEINFIIKIGITLGIALITYIYGLLLRSRENNMLSQVMFTISAVLAPIWELL